MTSILLHDKRNPCNNVFMNDYPEEVRHRCLYS